MRKNTTRVFEPTTSYRVVPMGPGRRSDALKLCHALSTGLVAQRDPSRDGFYSVELGGHAFYIHIHEATKTLYILGAAPNRRVKTEEVQPRLKADLIPVECMPS